MKCKHCGRPLEPNAEYCRYCGEHVRVQQHRPAAEPAPVPRSRNRSKSKQASLPKWILPTFCITAVILLIVSILAILRNHMQPASQYAEVTDETPVVITAESTEATDPPAEETIAVAEIEPTEAPYDVDSVWAKAYYQQIQAFEKEHADFDPDRSLKYRLLYIDDNEVPELYMQAGNASALYTIVEDEPQRIYEAETADDEKLIGVLTRHGTYLSSRVTSSGERYSVNLLEDGKVTETESYHSEGDEHTINGASVDLVSYTQYVRAKQAAYQLTDIPVYNKEKLLTAMRKAANGEGIPNPAPDEKPIDIVEQPETTDTTEETDNETGEKRFEVYTGMYTWSEAQAKCKEKGGHLAYIKSKADYDAVLEAIDKADDSLSYLWVGGRTYIKEDGKTVTSSWADGSSTRYIDDANLWYGHEPSGKDGDTLEPYMMLWNLGSGWTFNDNSDACVEMYKSGSMGYVCEFHD